jgi:hypothetical protein
MLTFPALSAFAEGFSPDSWWMYLLYGVIVAYVSIEAVFYLLKSIKQAKKLGISMDKIKKVITTSASFSILPAIGIGIGVVTLVGALGIAFPAIRLSVIGALQYETQTADSVAKGIFEAANAPKDMVANAYTLIIQRGVTAQDFATMAFMMTVSIILGPLFVTLFYKKLQPQITRLGNMEIKAGDEPDPNATQKLETTFKKRTPASINVGDLVFQVSFIGMILGYLAMSISPIVNNPSIIKSYYNLIAVVIAAGVMVLSDFLIKKFNWKWLDSFSTAFSMLLAMLVVAIISKTTGLY